MFIKHSRLLAIVFFSVFATYAGESEAQRQSSSIVSYANVLQWTFGLAIVLAMFGLFVWVMRKTGNFSFNNKSQLAVISGLSLGMREKLVLVKVGEKQLLLGVTPGRVDKLMELEGDERLFQNQTDKKDAGNFAKKLQQVMQSRVDV